MNQKPINHQPGLIWITSPPGGTRWRIRCRTNRWHRPIAQFFFRVATNLLIHWLFIDCLTTVVPSEMQATGWLSGDQLNPPPLPQKKKKKMKNTTTVTPHSSINWMATIIKSPISCFLTAPVAAPLLRPLLPILVIFHWILRALYGHLLTEGSTVVGTRTMLFLSARNCPPPQKKKIQKKATLLAAVPLFLNRLTERPQWPLFSALIIIGSCDSQPTKKKTQKKTGRHQSSPETKKKRNETLLIGC